MAGATAPPSRHRPSASEKASLDAASDISVSESESHHVGSAKALWAPDRGRGYAAGTRERARRPSLIHGGKRVGQSRVQFAAPARVKLHRWTADFFVSALHLTLPQLLLAVAALYLLIFLVFAALWWAVWRGDPRCLSKSEDSGTTFTTAFLFSIATTQTIGYGNTAPNDCAWSLPLLITHVLVAVVTEAVVIGLVFARISHPQHRARTVAISEVATIARRDGVLKFCFRVCDMQSTPVVQPTVKAYLYTWGAGRTTAEGEFIPVRIEELNIGYIDGAFILPLIIEHTIDEASPLHGHTHDSLVEAAAEIVVSLEASSEFGTPFVSRRSFLPWDIVWGAKFVRMISAPPAGVKHPRYVVDIDRLHDVEPLDAAALLPPPALSRAVVGRAARVAPYPLLGENTLVISDSLCLARTRSGATALMFRVGDSYPSQTIEACVKCYLWRWKPKGGTAAGGGFVPGEPDDFEVVPLDVGYADGSDRPLLWLPIVFKHVITPASPLARWLTPGGRLRDADATIAVSIEGYKYATSQNVVRSRLFSVARDVKEGHSFVSIVAPPFESPDLRPRVNWAAFHDTVRVVGAEPGPPVGAAAAAAANGGGGRGVAARDAAPAAAPAADDTAPAAAPPAGDAAPAAPPADRPPNLHRNSIDQLRSDAAALGRASAAHALGDERGGATASASAPARPAVSAAGSRRGRGPLATTAPPEGAGGMLLPPSIDPSSTFRLRAAAARARLDAALFEVAEDGGRDGAV